MIFHENRLLADDSHEISCPIFFENWERCLKKLLSAAVVNGALRVNLSALRTVKLQGVERSGSVVECLTRDRGAAGSNLTGTSAFCPSARHINPSLVLVQPRKTCSFIIEC